MKTAKISLNSIDKVKAFVNEISKFDCDFDLVSGVFVIDYYHWPRCGDYRFDEEYFPDPKAMIVPFLTA